ncbi:hypothetical protein HYH03_015087 [Edaphochlamys debaryana]|uniref:Acetyltransferase component of pyruvate dehydrogenase complex n=1 Tax=Edaphochlamys debaryana TaxID=47281 RepID=A0A835XNZ1_9CHLO|nr:hypothetical protein HYH03_015087 [Edaphochlamys debaryana]|eukprot:KAG2486263.1 hypothetical protein HYH03_015087 [Edaphochlamys debaryana]
MPSARGGQALKLAWRALNHGAASGSTAAAWAPAHRLPWLSAFTLARHFASYPAHVVLNMPSLSPTMTQGNITKWRKQPGEQIAPGQILAEVETDKATIEWEAQEEGFMAKHLVPEGTQDIAVGTPVAVLAEEAEGVAGLAAFAPGAAASAAAAPAAAPAPPPKPAATKPAQAAANLPPHQVLNMPALSPTMNRGNIVAWKKKVGEPVAPGDVYCEVETDKATISWESQEEGYIAKFLLGDGSKEIEVGTPALVLVEERDMVDALKDFTPGEATASVSAAAPAAAEAPKPAPAAPAKAAPAAAPAAPATAGPGGRLHVSPYARKLAAELGVQLQAVAGTGPGGRIVAADVSAAPRGAVAATTPEPSFTAPASGVAAAAPTAAAVAPGGTYTDVPHSQIRRVVARRLLESKQTVPHYYLSIDCNVEELLALRERMNSASAASAGGKGKGADGAAPPKLSVNDFIVKAAARALKTVPGVNASWQPDFTRLYSNVDISVAVQTPGGLQVPIVRDADLKSLGAISAEIRALAAKAKAGKLVPEDYVGGTFTISNLGMYGIKQFAAIINPPQSAILAVGASTPTVVRGAGGVFKEVPVLTATLSCDHRVIDGAMGAEWLGAFKAGMESPLLTMI